MKAAPWKFRCCVCKQPVRVQRNQADVEMAAYHMRAVAAGELLPCNRRGLRPVRIKCEGSTRPAMVDL